MYNLHVSQNKELQLNKEGDGSYIPEQEINVKALRFLS